MDPLVVSTSTTGVVFLMNFVSNMKAMDPNNHPAEDSKLGVDDEKKAAFVKRVAEQGGVDRWTRVAHNNRENLAIALGVLWAAFTTSPLISTKVMYCFLVYIGARVLFVLCYVFSLSPWRSLAFLIGQGSILVAAGFALAQTGGVFDLPLIGIACPTIFYLMNFVARALSSDPNNHPAEDKVLGSKYDTEGKEGYKKMMEEKGFSRWHRIAENQGEQFPIAVLILLSTMYVQNDVLSGQCMLCYLAFRFLFLVCYLLALQPFRSIFFILGNVTVIVSAVCSILAAKGNDDTTQLTATVCNLVIFLMYNVALIKAINPNDHPAEDSKLGINDSAKAAFAKRIADQGGVDRWTRIATNQIENFPLALYVLWAAVFAGVGINAAYCFGTYLMLRIVFLICYLFGVQPLRSISFILSQVTLVAAVIFGVLAAQP